MSLLLDFLQRLSDDPDLIGEYKQAPDTVLATAGLSAEAREAVKSGDLGTVRSVVTAELGTEPLDLPLGIWLRD
jgi:hypothetical protein